MKDNKRTHEIDRSKLNRVKKQDSNGQNSHTKNEHEEGQERLQKVLAQAGVASRRNAEKIILSGRVEINGKKVITLGTKVTKKDIVTVDGRLIKVQDRLVYIVLNKPTGVITSAKDPQGRKTVLDCITKVKERVYPVGRLDFDTSGLLVLTNDGELAHRLMHPSFGVEKTYRVGIKGSVPDTALKQLSIGVLLDDGKTAPAKVKRIKPYRDGSLEILEITIHEGRNRQVRRMFETIGYPVIKLERIRFGPIIDASLNPGNYRFLKENEVKELRKYVGLTV